MNPCKSFGNLLWKGFDVVIVDGVVNGTAKLVMGFAAGLKGFSPAMCITMPWEWLSVLSRILAFYVFR